MIGVKMVIGRSVQKYIDPIDNKYERGYRAGEKASDFKYQKQIKELSKKVKKLKKRLNGN